MFTGIVEEVGTVLAVELNGHSAILGVEAPITSQGMQVGDSLAVNGCCLTVVRRVGTKVWFDAVPETLRRTNLGGLQKGDRVNLERPLAANGRLGGHFVQGHVDGVGVIDVIREDENARGLEIVFPAELGRYLVEKGSIAVDGVSLTIASITATTFSVWLIPHTCEVTTLGQRRVGDKVNLECDLLGKYVERLLQEGLSRYLTLQQTK